MTELDRDTRIIVVRRGELMRIAYPITQYMLDVISAPELALSAVALFMQLQAEYPGRADMPITSKTGPMALALPFANNVLSDDEPLWMLLAGHWTDHDIDVVGDVADEMKQFPALALNLVDLHKGV